MKKFPLSTFSRTAMAAVAAVALTACVHVRDGHYEPTPHYPPQAVYYDYWYYPAIGCYFDIRTNYYIYFEHDRWIRVRVLPPHLRPYLGRHVIIRSPHQRPYAEHQRHQDQYPPERYKKTKPGEKGNDAWVGPPRTQIPDRDRRDRSRDQDRNGGDMRRDGNGDRGPGAGQRENRERAEDYKRQEPKTQSQEAPGRREPDAITAPARPPYKASEQENRKEAPQKRDRDASERRGDDRNKDANESKPGEERRSPDSRDETVR
jgi:hypothetical protein